MSTKIEWADMTWNPITGCARVSPGCSNCYSERLSKRLSAMGQKKYDGVTKPEGGWSGEVRLHWEMLEDPGFPKTPKRIFVGSMSDWMHPEVPEEFIERLIGVMRGHPQHTFMMLTKRPYRMAKLLGGAPWWAGTERQALSHIWLGVSIESPDYNSRFAMLKRVWAQVYFISAEPLLSRPRLSDFLSHCIYPDWVIIGGESGGGARRMEHDWVRAGRDQALAMGAALFFKQWSSANPGPICPETKLPMIDGHTWAQYPGEEA